MHPAGRGGALTRLHQHPAEVYSATLFQERFHQVLVALLRELARATINQSGRTRFRAPAGFRLQASGFRLDCTRGETGAGAAGRARELDRQALRQGGGVRV